MAFQASTFYQSWGQRLRLSWMGAKGRAWINGLTKVLGDLTIDWATQANLEHLPQYASPPSVALTTSERQIDAGPYETSTALASRITSAVQNWQLAGTPLGLLLALYYANFPYAYVFQQNGLGFTLSLPVVAPIPGVVWNPSVNLVTFNESTLITTLASSVTPPTTLSVGRSIPTSTPWWTFDSNTDLCSRFAVVFPGPMAGAMITYGTATFSNSSTAAVVWNNPFLDTTYQISVGAPVIVDGGGGVVVTADIASKTTAGVTATASGTFTGTATLLAWATGNNPLCWLRAADLARIKAVITKWKPAKSTCVGIYGVAEGQCWGYPIRTWGSGGLWGPAQVVTFTYP